MIYLYLILCITHQTSQPFQSYSCTLPSWFYWSMACTGWGPRFESTGFVVHVRLHVGAAVDEPAHKHGNLAPRIIHAYKCGRGTPNPIVALPNKHWNERWSCYHVSLASLSLSKVSELKQPTEKEVEVVAQMLSMQIGLVRWGESIGWYWILHCLLFIHP